MMNHLAVAQRGDGGRGVGGQHLDGPEIGSAAVLKNEG